MHTEGCAPICLGSTLLPGILSKWTPSQQHLFRHVAPTNKETRREHFSPRFLIKRINHNLFRISKRSSESIILGKL